MVKALLRGALQGSVCDKSVAVVYYTVYCCNRDVTALKSVTNHEFQGHNFLGI